MDEQDKYIDGLNLDPRMKEGVSRAARGKPLRFNEDGSPDLGDPTTFKAWKQGEEMADKAKYSKMRKNVDDYLGDKVEKGLPPSLAAGASAVADFMLPTSSHDTAVPAPPVGKAMKGLKRMLSKGDDKAAAGKKLFKNWKEEPTLDYGAMEKERKAAKTAAEEAAPSVDYGAIKQADEEARLAKRAKKGSPKPLNYKNMK